MSLQDIIAQQHHIVAEQKAIRADLQQLVQRLESNFKGEIQRLVQRLDANDSRISRLSGGAEAAPPEGPGGGERPRGYGASSPSPGPCLEPNSDAAPQNGAREFRFRPLSPMRPELQQPPMPMYSPDSSQRGGLQRGIAAAAAAPARGGARQAGSAQNSYAQESRSPLQSRSEGDFAPGPFSPAPGATGAGGYAALRPPGRSGAASPQPQRRSEGDLAAVKAVVANAVKSASKSHAWEEPADGKPAPATLDRCESLLRSAFERSRDFKKYSNNPIQGVQVIFQRLDRNHSGKIDEKELRGICTLLEFEADAKTLSALFNRYDLDHSGCITLDEFGRALFKVDGDSEFKAKSAIARMREVLSLRAGGYESLKAIGSQFRIIDRDRSGQLTKEEYNIALDILFSAYNVKFSAAERNALFQSFDYDKSGTVSYDEFVRGIRGDMNDFRLGWIKQAFATLDKDGSGVVETQEMAATYDVSQNPAVKSGKVTPEEAIQQFMKHYDGNHDGTITLDEFTENYQWVSASIDSDDYFELMIRNAWHLTGGEGWCANTSNLRVLVRHGSGYDEVVEVQHDLGLPHDPAKKYQEVIRRLQQQGVKDIRKIEFNG